MVAPTLKYLVVLLAIVFCYGSSSFAQARPPSDLETKDGRITIPKRTGVLEKRDPTALAEISSHLGAIGAGAWSGMQGSGTITYGPNATLSNGATLTNVGGKRFRLDEMTDGGSTSIRIHGFTAKERDKTGALHEIPATTAILTMFPFEIPRLPHLLSPYSSVTDQGMVTIGTTQLHRITVEYPTLGKAAISNTPNTAVVDLYFDPQTHLLEKTATEIELPRTRTSTYLSVVTYSDYRLVGATLVPFTFTETLQGQPFRTLRLATVDLNPSVDPAYFDF